MITLVRHAPLLPPYDDYNQLTLDQLEALSVGDVDPPIDPVRAQALVSDNTILAGAVAGQPRLICAGSLRAQQTAQVTRQAYPDLPEPAVSKDWNEIMFSVRGMLSASLDPAEGLLPFIRTHLYTGLQTGMKGIEPLADLQVRIAAAFSAVREPAIIVTHGFLIRLIVALEKCDYNWGRVFDTINDVPPIDYVQAVVVQGAQSIPA